MKRKFHFLTWFLRALSSLLHAGVPLLKSLKSLYFQQHQEWSRKILERMCYRVATGWSLSAAMKEETVFPKFVVELVYFGEETGRLVQNLERAAFHMEQSFKTRLKIYSTLAYPFFLMGTSLLGTFFLVKVFLPIFLPLFKEMGRSLPWSTRFLIFTVSFFSSGWFWGLGVVVLSALLFLYSRCHGRALLALPYFGKAVKFEISARVTRTLATLHASGVPMMKGLSVLEKSIDNEIFRRFLRDARLRFASGQELSKIFLSCRNLIPSCVGHMMAVAEETGDVNLLMLKCTRILEEEIDGRIQRLARWLEPGILAFMGAQISFVLFSLISPLYEMAGALQ